MKIRQNKNSMVTKEFFRTCNVLPFSCTHLALWRGKVKDPRYMQNKKDSRISLMVTVEFETGHWAQNCQINLLFQRRCTKSQ
jgi:hypothetical protein